MCWTGATGASGFLGLTGFLLWLGVNWVPVVAGGQFVACRCMGVTGSLWLCRVNWLPVVAWGQVSVCGCLGIAGGLCWLKCSCAANGRSRSRDSSTMSSGSTIKCPDGRVALVFYGPTGEERVSLPKCVLRIEAGFEVLPLLPMNSGLQITNIVRGELDAYHPSRQAKVIHKKMREFWEQTNGTGLDKDLEDLRWHLGRILFLQRKRVGSTDASQLGLAFASQERTCRAIQDVLELRQRYLRSQGISADNSQRRAVLTNKQRVELVERARAHFENSQEQRDLKMRDESLASLSLCGDFNIVVLSFLTGKGIGPLITAPVFLTVSTINLAEASISL